MKNQVMHRCNKTGLESISLHGGDNGIEFFPFHGELLEVVYSFVLALSGYFLNLEPKVLEELMDVDIPFQNKDAPPIASRMLNHQKLEYL